MPREGSAGGNAGAPRFGARTGAGSRQLRYDPPMPRERELKYDLRDEAATRRVEHALAPPVSARRQENRFFDTPARDLRRARWALRLRAEWDVAPGDDPGDPGTAAAPEAPPARVILSLKGAREGSGAFHDRREEQRELAPQAWNDPAAAAADLPAPWLALLPPLAGGLVEVARFRNLRRAHPLRGAWRVEVDRTLYADGRAAWELELEIGESDDPAVAAAALAELFARAGVAPQPQERSKLQRALEADDGRPVSRRDP